MRFFFALLGLAITAGGGWLFLEAVNLIQDTPQSGRWQWIIMGSLIVILGVFTFINSVKKRKRGPVEGWERQPKKR